MRKSESEFLSMVADMGCIICHGPAEIHHLREGQGMKRASHFEVIPLCPMHRRTGGHGIAFHAGKETWQAKHGNETDLHHQMMTELGIELMEEA